MISSIGKGCGGTGCVEGVYVDSIDIQIQVWALSGPCLALTNCRPTPRNMTSLDKLDSWTVPCLS